MPLIRLRKIPSVNGLLRGFVLSYQEWMLDLVKCFLITVFLFGHSGSFAAAHRPSPVVASWVTLQLWRVGLLSSCGELGYSLVVVHGLLLLQRLWARKLHSAQARSCACGFRCSTAGGIFQDQGSNPYPLRWWVDSHVLYHQGTPIMFTF